MPPKREMQMDDVRFRVHESTVLKTFPQHEAARALLDRALVPINELLKQHRWRVLKVSEFFPKNDNLLGLNVNHGQHVKVRMRPHFNRNEFFAYEEIVCTLVHEVVHNTISPHDASFWALYHKLVAEAELFLSATAEGRSAAGVTNAAGAGGMDPAAPEAAPVVPFAGEGRRLGGAAKPPPSAEEMRRRCAEAAARRVSLTGASRRSCAAGACAAQRVAPSDDGGGGDAASTVAGVPRSSQGAPWACEWCGFSNHPLLPYCERCCSEDTPAEVHQGPAPPSAVVTKPAGAAAACRDAPAAAVVVVDSDDEEQRRRAAASASAIRGPKTRRPKRDRSPGAKEAIVVISDDDGA